MRKNFVVNSCQRGSGAISSPFIFVGSSAYAGSSLNDAIREEP